MEVSKNRENTIIFLTKCLLVVLGLFTTIPYINDVGRDIYKPVSYTHLHWFCEKYTQNGNGV